jgi:MFS family permease
VGRYCQTGQTQGCLPGGSDQLSLELCPWAATPLQYYLTNELHASDAVYSNYNAIFTFSFIPTFLLYGFLCRKYPLRKLLLWGTIIGVPQLIPLAFIHSGSAAEVLAVPIGLMGGIATAAYIDLAMRSCPPGLQGTLMMMVDGVVVLAGRGGDILGTWIYDVGKPYGFRYCVIAITLVYAAILPVILLIPKHIIATADGEENPVVTREVLAEIGETS